MKFPSWNIICSGRKEPIKVQFFRFLSALMKVHTIPRGIFETTSSALIQLLYHCSVSWKVTPLYFCSSNLVYFGQEEPITKKFSDFWVVGWTITNFLKTCLKPQVSCFRVMSHDTEDWCIIWWWKTDLWFGKMTWRIWPIFSRALRNLKIETLMGSFYPK